eukprot:PITA_04072
MTDYKPALTPFLYGVHLEDGGDTPLVDSTLYRQLVGSLLYRMHSRLDLSYAVGVVSRYMQESHELHWNAAKRILQYVYSLSQGSGPICWSNKKQAAISLSSAEAEYRGVANITIQALWLQHFLIKLGIQFHQPTVIWCDNQSTLKFCRDQVQRQQMKYIEIHMHYIRDLVHD